MRSQGWTSSTSSSATRSDRARIPSNDQLENRIPNRIHRDVVPTSSRLFQLPPVEVRAQNLPTREEVLHSVFPGSEVRSEKLYLTREQVRRASEIAGGSLETRLVARYVATRNGETIGSAYIDTHTVRTKKQSLIICIDPDGRVLRVEATAFLEPPEYLASEPFLEQYEGRALSRELHLNRRIRPIAGATLTVQAVNRAVRRILALHRILTAERAGSAEERHENTTGSKR